mgnify:CR=1 FL=1
MKMQPGVNQAGIMLDAGDWALLLQLFGFVIEVLNKCLKLLFACWLELTSNIQYKVTNADACETVIILKQVSRNHLDVQSKKSLEKKHC